MFSLYYIHAFSESPLKHQCNLTESIIGKCCNLPKHFVC